MKYSDLLQDILSVWPTCISTKRVKRINGNGLYWPELDETYEELEPLFFNNELKNGLLWSVVVGISEGYKKSLLSNSNIDCFPLVSLDYEKVNSHFKETLEDDYYKNYLSEIGEAVMFE